ncbi:MAG: hypothetical protein HW421_3249 [Ignavibacteria bacterium]|nr:hypothetical protein [Ignavibacteria bacterium]
MQVSELTLKLILVLIPGIISTIIYDKLTIHKKWESLSFLANCIFFGCLSYMFAQLIFQNLFGVYDIALQNFWNNLSQKEIPFSAIWKASIIAILIGFISSWFEYKKVVNRLGRKLHLTNKFGDENLYSFFLNSKEVKEVYIRDKKNDLTYHGFVRSFAETDEFKEIVLYDVSVYRYSDSILLYEIDNLYLAQPKDDLIIELPYIYIKET